MDDILSGRDPQPFKSDIGPPNLRPLSIDKSLPTAVKTVVINEKPRPGEVDFKFYRIGIEFEDPEILGFTQDLAGPK